MIVLAERFWKTRIRVLRAIEIAFKYDMGSVIAIENPAQFLLVLLTSKSKFYPRSLLGTRCVIQDSKIKSFVKHSRSSRRQMFSLSHTLLQEA